MERESEPTTRRTFCCHDDIVRRLGDGDIVRVLVGGTFAVVPSLVEVLIVEVLIVEVLIVKLESWL